MPSEGAGEAVPSPLPRQASPVPSRPAAGRPPLPRTVGGLPQLEPAFWQVVDTGLQRLRVELTAGGRSAIAAQARLLLAWSPFVNLTALRDAEQIARGHVLDSLAALPLLRSLAPRRLLDLGSGAGFPGLPLAVCLPAADCALVDSVGKKQAFLSAAAEAARAAMREAGEQPPDILALAERAEDVAQAANQREAWDLTTARAIGSLAEVLELCLPLTRIGGHVVAWKRRPPDGSLEREMAAARRVLQAAGGGRPKLDHPPGLAHLGLAEHVLVVVRKMHPTPHHYPRPPAERRRALLR